MATSYLTQPGGGYASNDPEIQAKLIAMGAKGASADSQVQTRAVSAVTPGVVVGGAYGTDPRGFQTQFQTYTQPPSRYNQDGTLNPGATPAAITPAATFPAPVQGSPTPTTQNSTIFDSYGQAGPNGARNLTPEEYNAKFGPKPVDEASIREQIRQENQARIDAINSAYDEMSRRQAVTNEGNLGSTRAINARSGLLGSDFGDSNTKNQQAANNRALAAIDAEKALQISGVYKEINKLTSDAVAAKKAEALGQADAYKNYLQDAQGKAKELAKTLGTSGLSFDQLKAQAPDQLKTILDNTSYDEFTLATIMNNNKKAAEKIDYQYKTIGNKVIGYGLNPKTGQIETIEKDLPAAEASNLQDYTPHTLADGTLILTPKQLDPTKSLKDQVLMYGVEGQFAKETPVKPITKTIGKALYQSLDNGKTWQIAIGVTPASSGSASRSSGTSSTSITTRVNAALGKIQNGINDKKLVGGDGFISPNDYAGLRNSWIAEGLNPTTFDTKMKGYRNPNDPGYVINKTDAGF